VPTQLHTPGWSVSAPTSQDVGTTLVILTAVADRRSRLIQACTSGSWAPSPRPRACWTAPPSPPGGTSRPRQREGVADAGSRLRAPLRPGRPAPTRCWTSRDEPMGWTVVTTASAPCVTARATASSAKSPTCSVTPCSAGALPARRTTASTRADRSTIARHTAAPTSPLAPVTTTTGGRRPCRPPCQRPHDGALLRGTSQPRGDGRCQCGIVRIGLTTAPV